MSVVEKAPVFGGTTAWSAGWMWVPRHLLAVRAGIVEDVSAPRRKVPDIHGHVSSAGGRSVRAAAYRIPRAWRAGNGQGDAPLAMRLYSGLTAAVTMPTAATIIMPSLMVIRCSS